MYSKKNEGKSSVAESFIRTLKNKIYKYIASLSKMCILINQMTQLIHTYHTTIKMKAADVKPSIYFDFNKENIKEGPKLKVGDQVRVSKYKNIFAKSYVPNWSQEVFVIKKVKNIVP